MACQVSIFLLCVKSFFFSKYVLISHAVSFVKSVRSTDHFDLYKGKMIYKLNIPYNEIPPKYKYEYEKDES